MKSSILIILSAIGYGVAQINLGSFFLHPQNGGGFDLGMGQGANILGFGGDRSFNLAGNRAGVAMGSNNGALVGGQRVGVDGGLGAGREGLEMGSQVQFGNNPSPMHPGGQLGNFLENVKNFFSFLGGGMPMPMPMTPQSPPSPPFSFGSMGMTKAPRLIGTEGAEGNHKPQPWFPEEENGEGMEGEERPSSSNGAKDGEVKASSSASGETEVISPNNGDKKDSFGKPKIDFHIDEQITEDIFTAQTDKPRQLPGLVEFA